MRYGLADHDLVGVVGGGFTFALSPRSGIRVDVRAHLGRNSASTTVDATPNVQAFSPVLILATTTSPSLQLSNNPASAAPSTLSGSPITAFETFEGSGTAQLVTFTAGWYFRF